MVGSTCQTANISCNMSVTQTVTQTAATSLTNQSGCFSANTSSSVTRTRSADASLTNLSTSELFSEQESTKLLPIILIQGPPGSGKGTLCKRLAKEFNLHHFSVGDWLCANGTAPIAGVSPRINRYVAQNKAIPFELFNCEFGGFDQAPSGLMLYQCTALNVSTPEALKINAMGPLREECERISAHGSFRGILVDNLHQCIGHIDKAVEVFGKGFPDLLIAVDCKDETAKTRFVGRARGSHDVHRFDRRLAKFRNNYEELVQHMGATRPVVRVSTEVETEQAYRDLVEALEGCEAWREIAE